MDALNIAVIGCGWAGEKHVKAIRALPGSANVTAIVDSDEVYMRERADEWGIPQTYVDYREVLSRDDIDAVSVCLPHNLHAEVCVESARSGKHILCEKPLAISAAACERIIESCQSTGGHFPRF